MANRTFLICFIVAGSGLTYISPSGLDATTWP